MLQVRKIFQQLRLGNIIGSPERLKGGLVHKLWKVKTDNGIYVIKQLMLSKISNKNFVENFELSERIADQFSRKGIKAVSAISFSGKYLIKKCEGTFIIYPWIKAQINTSLIPSEAQAIKIANLLAQIHRIDLKVENMIPQSFNYIRSEILSNSIDAALKKQFDYQMLLRKHRDAIIANNDRYISAISIISDDPVITHGDLDQKNVLWDKDDDPILIDWESARLLNPTYDLINVSLDWSGLSSNNFNEGIFVRMIKTYYSTYKNLGSRDLDAIIDCIIGNWINWLNFNLNRFVDTTNKNYHKLSVEQIGIALSNIISLKKMHSKLITLVNSVR